MSSIRRLVIRHVRDSAFDNFYPDRVALVNEYFFVLSIRDISAFTASSVADISLHNE